MKKETDMWLSFKELHEGKLKEFLELARSIGYKKVNILCGGAGTSVKFSIIIEENFRNNL